MTVLVKLFTAALSFLRLSSEDELGKSISWGVDPLSCATQFQTSLKLVQYVLNTGASSDHSEDECLIDIAWYGRLGI